ncbi:histone deacetylase complex subunit SAP30L isoform X2 [Hyperolius riggenbachi]|uniref:histone deacetylase complex subunit SAP30L isoform X2 n=1 Tax=Hyperolius riggenbachi TaxID=752182 RepID=UPI0035A2E0C9
MNGFSTEEDSRDGPPAPAAPFYGQTCCLIDGGERCARPAGNASFSKRVQKSLSQKRLKLDIDRSVRHLYICDFHKNYIQSVRNKRKRKTSDDGADSPEHETDVPEGLFNVNVLSCAWKADPGFKTRSVIGSPYLDVFIAPYHLRWNRELLAVRKALSSMTTSEGVSAG